MVFCEMLNKTYHFHFQHRRTQQKVRGGHYNHSEESHLKKHNENGQNPQRSRPHLAVKSTKNPRNEGERSKSKCKSVPSRHDSGISYLVSGG